MRMGMSMLRVWLLCCDHCQKQAPFPILAPLCLSFPDVRAGRWCLAGRWGLKKTLRRAV